ncbi:two-component system, sporulation sensor kinase A [uncultured bacterium]|nr:two-component system, sporulation sensor kinase A [uncultured bacterium]
MSREFLRMYERIIAPAPDHISIVSRDYEYLVVNDAYLRCHGKKRADIVGRKVPDLLGERIFNEKVKANLDRCFAGETVNYREWFEFPASGRRFMNVVYYPYVMEGAIEGAVVVSRDITEYRAAEKRLEESEEKYRHLFENLNDAAFLADCETGLIIQTNIKGEALLGMTREEIIGMHQKMLHPPAKALEYAEKFAVHIAKGKSADYEGEAVRKDGTIVPVFISAAPVDIGGKKLILGLFRDITAQKRSEAALTESKMFSESIIASMQDGFSVFDPQRKFIDGNPAFFTMTGYTREELAGLAPPFPYWPVKEAGEIGRAFDDLEKGVRRDYEFSFVRKDGTVFPVLMSPSQLTGKNGKVLNYFAILKDISLRKKMESELMKAQKLDSLGKLGGGLAHDFNNILTGILSNISLAIYYGQGEQPLKRLEAAEKAALRAKELMRQFLTFARGNASAKKTIDLRPLIAEWPGLALAGSNVRCEVSIEEGLLPVDGDVEMLSQAIRNVVANAAEAMPGGGTVKITASNFNDGAPMKAPSVIISIEDSGTGIAENDIDKIFDPYFTTKEGASGLGLATAYSVIDDHGGLIEVDSRPSIGTTVSIRLPAAPVVLH